MDGEKHVRNRERRIDSQVGPIFHGHVTLCNHSEVKTNIHRRAQREELMISCSNLITSFRDLVHEVEIFLALTFFPEFLEILSPNPANLGRFNQQIKVRKSDTIMQAGKVESST